ncbi:hypothetical protein GEMRC1_001551 [Eukaryota sp. GEM-RC1]
MLTSCLETSSDEIISTAAMPLLTALKDSISKPGQWVSPVITSSVSSLLLMLTADHYRSLNQVSAKLIAKTAYFSSSNPFVVRYFQEYTSSNVSLVKQCNSQSLLIAQSMAVSQLDFKLLSTSGIIQDAITSISYGSRVNFASFELLVLLVLNFPSKMIEDNAVLSIFDDVFRLLSKPQVDSLLFALRKFCSNQNSNCSDAVGLIANFLYKVSNHCISVQSQVYYDLWTVLLSSKTHQTVSLYEPVFLELLSKHSKDMFYSFALFECLACCDLTAIDPSLVSSLISYSVSTVVHEYFNSVVSFWSKVSWDVLDIDYVAMLFNVLPYCNLRTVVGKMMNIDSDIQLLLRSIVQILAS